MKWSIGISVRLARLATVIALSAFTQRAWALCPFASGVDTDRASEYLRHDMQWSNHWLKTRFTASRPVQVEWAISRERWFWYVPEFEIAGWMQYDPTEAGVVTIPCAPPLGDSLLVCAKLRSPAASTGQVAPDDRTYAVPAECFGRGWIDMSQSALWEASPSDSEQKKRMLTSLRVTVRNLYRANDRDRRLIASNFNTHDSRVYVLDEPAAPSGVGDEPRWEIHMYEIVDRSLSTWTLRNILLPGRFVLLPSATVPPLGPSTEEIRAMILADGIVLDMPEAL